MMRPDRAFHSLGTAVLVAILAVLVIGATGPAMAGRTKLVKDIVPGSRSSRPHVLITVSGMTFFLADRRRGGSQDQWLWRTRGNSRSTKALVALGNPGWLRDIDGTLGFTRSSGDGRGGPNYSFHRSDGTRKGTRPWGALADQVAWLHDLFKARLGDAYLFSDHRCGRGELCRTDDGTFSGGKRVKDILVGAHSSPRWLTTVAGIVYFTANDGVHGRELWRSDGTNAGTWLVADIVPGPRDAKLENLTAVGGMLFFTADDDASGREVWTSDGTAPGTRRVKDLWPGPEGSRPRSLIGMGGKLYFVADNGSTGLELWRTGGTAATTKLVRDIRRGVLSSSPKSLTRVGKRLFFAADDGRRGRELWSSTGTGKGTRIVKDLRPGPKGSYPAYLARLGRKLIFAATTKGRGRELWKWVP